MTYLDIINKFWREHHTPEMKNADIVFYFHLLNVCNSQHWINPIEIHTSEIVAELGISKTELTRIRERLEERGLITYRPAKNQKSPSIYYLKDADFTNKKFRKKDLAVTYTLLLKKSAVTSTLLLKKSENAEIKQDRSVKARKRVAQTDCAVTYTLLQNDKPAVTSTLLHTEENLEDKRVKQNGKSVSSNQKTENKKSSSNLYVTALYNKDKDKDIDNNILSMRVREEEMLKAPSIENVREYFRHHQAAGILNNVDAQADEFFYHYDALGWCNGSGVRIIKWQSMASKWIMRAIKEQDNGNIKTKPSNSRGLQAKLPPKPEFGLIK